MKKAIIERKLRRMSDGRKTHVVTFYINNRKKEVSTNIGKGIGVEKLSLLLRKMGWEVEVKEKQARAKADKEYDYIHSGKRGHGSKRRYMRRK